MPDLNVVAVLKAKAGAEAALQGALTELVAPTRAEEGCLSYELFESIADATTFITIERWRSEEDLDAHMTTAHVAAALASAADALAEPPAIHSLAPVATVS